MTRSINASLTTFVMLLILYIFGVSSIREFALPLMVGIVLGTYSSVCLAGALWYMMGRFWGKKRAVAVKEEPRAKKAGKKKD